MYTWDRRERIERDYENEDATVKANNDNDRGLVTLNNLLNNTT